MLRAWLSVVAPGWAAGAEPRGWSLVGLGVDRGVARVSCRRESPPAEAATPAAPGEVRPRRTGALVASRWSDEESPPTSSSRVTTSERRMRAGQRPSPYFPQPNCCRANSRGQMLVSTLMRRRRGGVLEQPWPERFRIDLSPAVAGYMSRDDASARQAAQLLRERSMSFR
jgi:hypothetical protein